jgi:hypothetical protein
VGNDTFAMLIADDCLTSNIFETFRGCSAGSGRGIKSEYAKQGSDETIGSIDGDLIVD